MSLAVPQIVPLGMLFCAVEEGQVPARVFVDRDDQGPLVVFFGVLVGELPHEFIAPLSRGQVDVEAVREHGCVLSTRHDRHGQTEDEEPFPLILILRRALRNFNRKKRLRRKVSKSHVSRKTHAEKHK